MGKTLVFGAAFIALTGFGLPALAQNDAQNVNITPLQNPTPRQLEGPNNVTDEKGTNEPTGLRGKMPPGSAVEEVKETRVQQELRGEKPAKEPLKTVINVNADMQIEQTEVILGELKGLAVQVKNNSDRPLIFHGDQAVAIVGGTTLKCAPETTIEKVTDPVLTVKQRLKHNFVSTTVAGGTIGGVPMRDGFKRQNGPVLGRYEKDEARREAEFSRFGDRIVWPNDSTKGVVYFATSTTVSGAQIQMPVSSLYDNSVNGAVVNTQQPDYK